MIEVYDIEVLINCFTYTGLDISNQKISTFVIHPELNQINEFYDHLEQLKGQIGYNNLHYDAQILQFLIQNKNSFKDKSGFNLTSLIYNQSQSIISSLSPFPEYPEWKLSVPQRDLFKIWHFDNKAKSCSLKWIQFMIDYPNLQEMPIKHYDHISKDQIQEILDYNLNDVLSTYELYKITIGQTDNTLYKGIDKLSLRKDISKEFGISCSNFNDVKIGDNINKITYCNIKNIDKKEIPKSNKEIDKFYFKDCFPSYYKFETTEFNNFINGLKNIEVKLEKDGEKEKQQFEFTFNGTTYIIAKGGLHSKDKPRFIVPNENEILEDADVGSMYPNSIRKRKSYPRHLGKEWLIGYTEVIQKRLDAKKLFKETKEGKYQAVQEAYKLALNGGGFGKTNEEHNWQYDPFVTMCTTIGSQIDLLMLIESLELAGLHVVSANTDGVVCLFDRFLIDIYYKVCKDWEIKVGNNDLGQLEYTEYKLLIQTSVNDYIAVKPSNEVKTKGDFVSDFELHKNKSARIVPLALQKYFIQGILPEKFINEHTNIFDFCLAVKGKGNNKFVSFDKIKNEEIELQKINRYYISNKGTHLLKKLPKLDTKKASNQIDIFGNIDTGIREAEVEAGWLSTIYNKHEEKSIDNYDINYQFYIDRCYKIINQIK